MYTGEDLSGKHLEWHVVVERISDIESGEELAAERSHLVTENHEGTLGIVDNTQPQLLPCHHMRNPGEPVAVCVRCSKAAGHNIFICSRCQVACAYCGLSICIACSRLGQTGNRYCSSKCARAHEKILGVEHPNPVSKALRTFLRLW